MNHIGGPHTEIHKNLNGNHLIMNTYLTDIVKTYKSGVQLRIDVPFLGFKEIESNENFSESEIFMNKRPLKVLKRFDGVESAGTEISYRCVRCCGCADCKDGERIECISIQEEVEQAIIDQSVTVDIR